MKISKNIFCQCMKPWEICINKPNSYKIDVRDLISTYNLSPYVSNHYLEYDFINNKPLQNYFKCRFTDKTTKSS